jgi:transcriptional regulator with XRE-family HTH domain
MGEPSVLGKRIRAFRLRKGWSQERLSQETGTQRVPRSSIAACEAGLQGLSLENVIKIADALGVSIDQLARGDVLDEDFTAARV